MFVKIKEHLLKESEFIEQNQKSWQELETYLKHDFKDPDRLQALFIKVSSDLAYARTYYPNRSVRKYLNNLTQQIFDKLIARTRDERLIDQIKYWFQHTLPAEMYRSRRSLLVSALIFLIAIGIGVITSTHDPSFARLILGDGYVRITESNINSGDPMAIYKDAADVDMFLGITLNNIQVAFFTFILGILGGIGSIYILVKNGIMVGVFQYFFYSKGLFLTSFLTIWIHGTIEISAIIIAGSAGLVLGKGLLFPKSYTRGEALQINAQRALTIMLGTVPLFIIAGLLESFVTRLTGMPSLLKWIIILLSAALILGLYVIYPYYYGKYLQPDGNQDIRDDFLSTSGKDYSPGIHSFGQNFSFSLQDSKKIYGDFLLYILLPFCILAGVVNYIELNQWSTNELAAELAPKFFNTGVSGMFKTVLYWISCTAAICLAARHLYPTLVIKRILPVVSLLTCIPIFIMSIFNGYWSLLALAILPIGFMALAVIRNSGDSNGKELSFQTLYQMAWNSYFPFLLPLCVYFAFLWCINLLISSGLLYILYDIVFWHDLFDSYYLAEIYILSLLTAVCTLLIVPFIYLLLHYTASGEILKRSAADLKEKIKSFHV